VVWWQACSDTAAKPASFAARLTSTLIEATRELVRRRVLSKHRAFLLGAVA
jgi:hypothetical protein